MNTLWLLSRVLNINIGLVIEPYFVNMVPHLACNEETVVFGVICDAIEYEVALIIIESKVLPHRHVIFQVVEIHLVAPLIQSLSGLLHFLSREWFWNFFVFFGLLIGVSLLVGYKVVKIPILYHFTCRNLNHENRGLMEGLSKDVIRNTFVIKLIGGVLWNYLELIYIIKAHTR